MVYDLNGTPLSTGGGSGMLNVLDHGFKGDGTTDNLAAFNALIAAHPAETLYFPKGVYAFSGKLVFDQCYMELDNAELKCTASTKVDRFIEIRGKMYPPETPQQDMFIRGNGKVNANFKADDCIAVARQKCTLLDHISIQNFQRYGICGKFNDSSMTTSDGQTEANLSYELMVRNCMIESSLDYPNAVGIYLARYPFLYLFTSDKAVVEAGITRLSIMALSYSASAFMDASIAASRGLGKTAVPTFVVVMGSCVFRIIWIYTIFAYFHTIQSLTFSMIWQHIAFFVYLSQSLLGTFYLPLSICKTIIICQVS